MDGCAAVEVLSGQRSHVRRATVEDVPFLVDLARERYPGRNLDHMVAWAEAVLKLPQAAIFICGDAAAIVVWQVEAWYPDAPVADVLPMFSRPNSKNPLAILRVLQACNEWRKERGCYALRFGSSEGARSRKDRGIDVFEPFARRLGARPWSITYMLED